MPIFLMLSYFFTRLFSQSSFDAIIQPPFPSFFRCEKIYSSTSEEMVIQQSLVIVLTWISQHPDRHRKPIWNFVHLLLYGGAYWDLFIFSRSIGYTPLWNSPNIWIRDYGIWGSGGRVSRRMVIYR